MRNILVLLMLLVAVCNPAHSATLFATVDSLFGSAQVSDDATQPVAVSAGQKIYAGQTVTTSSDGEVHLETEDGGIIAIRPNSVFRVDEYKADGGPDDRIFMSLAKGAMRSITGWIGKYNVSGYRITTPSATIGIRGTDHETTVIGEGGGDEPGTYDMVNEGVTVLKTQYGERDVTPERFAFAPRFRAVAPLYLPHKPNFWAKRQFVIEGLIAPRKELLRDRIKQLRENRIQKLHENRIKQQEKMRDRRTGQPPGKVQAKEGRKPAGEVSKEMRAKQREQAEQRRKALSKERKRDAAVQNGSNEKAERIKREQRPRQENKNKN